MTDTQALYLETIQILAKAVGNNAPRGYQSSLNKIHDANETKTLKVVQSVLKKARTRFLSKFKVDKLSFAKADSSDAIKAELHKIMAAAFAGASDELVASLEQHIDDIAKNFSSVYDVDINYKVVNDKAVAYLKNNTDNYFTTLSDEQASGIQSAIADAMQAEEGYQISDIVGKIRDAFGKDTMYFPDKEMDATDWAVMVARTETARAASYSQQATLENLDLQTWQWQAQGGSCCDDCDENLDEIVNIGDEFPSGDTEPPAHPNCRCICIAVMEELISSEDDESPEEE